MSVTRRVFLRRSGAATAGLALGRAVDLGATQHAMPSRRAAQPRCARKASRSSSMRCPFPRRPSRPDRVTSGVRTRSTTGPSCARSRAGCTAICRPPRSGASARRFPGRRSRPGGDRDCGSTGSISCRRSTSCRSTTPFTAPRPTCPRVAPSSTFTAPGCRPKATAIRNGGSRPGASASYYYPNDQDAATLWYHDHTMGINRLNVYAGLMGVYLIRDAAEDALNLPRDRYDIPLLICDRLLRSDGQLDYPDLRQSGFAVGRRCDRRCDPDQRQAVSVSRRRAAQVSLPHHQRLERTFPAAVGRRTVRRCTRSPRIRD